MSETATTTKSGVRKASKTSSRYSVSELGERLRKCREARALTITELSHLTGVPISTISKIEKGRLKPTFVHAINLASALNENLGFLVERFRSPPSSRVVVLKQDRDKINYPEMGQTLEDLTGRFWPGILEARISSVKRGAHSGKEVMRHPGEEICHIISGQLRYTIGASQFQLHPGDTIQFKSSQAHRWENISRGVTVAIWGFSDGLSF